MRPGDRMTLCRPRTLVLAAAVAAGAAEAHEPPPPPVFAARGQSCAAAGPVAYRPADGSYELLYDAAAPAGDFPQIQGLKSGSSVYLWVNDGNPGNNTEGFSAQMRYSYRPSYSDSAR
jgi:hypothetical protein